MDEVSQPLGACDAARADSSVDDARGGRRGGGGLWHAFVREPMSGREGRPTVRELGIEYKRMSAADRKRLAPVGAAATRTPGCASALVLFNAGAKKCT